MSIGRVPFIVASLLLILGTFGAVKLTTDRLLYEDAVATAQKWALKLIDNTADIGNIAAGDEPSAESGAFLAWARHVDFVLRYVVYDPQGHPGLVADRHQPAPAMTSAFSREAADAAGTLRPIVAVQTGATAAMPPYYAAAYVPVVVDGRAVAVVAAFVDQTAKRDRFHTTFIFAAFGLCLLNAIAFGLPAAFWYRRAREKQRADAEVTFLVGHDGLTRFPNRARLCEMLSETLAHATAPGSVVAVHQIALDGYAEIKDALGVSCCDAIIRLMAERIRAAVGPQDVVARLCGCEFAVVQPAIAGAADAGWLAERLLDAIAKPFRIDGRDIAATASLGIALAPEHATASDRLLKGAYLALAKSRGEGGNAFRYFTAEMDADLRARLKLEVLVRDAAAQERFLLQLQPMVNMPDATLAGFEALLRLNDQDGNPVPASAFVPVAEDLGLLDAIGSWAIRRACAMAARWPGQLTIAVDLSFAQFRAGGVADVVAAALAESGLEPRRLELGVAEAVLLRGGDTVVAELSRLKTLGVAIAMDDFGTADASSTSLWRFPFDKIRIDHSFVANLRTSPERLPKDTRAIVDAVIGLGHALRMRIAFKGIENVSQADFVRDSACDEAQGRYFGWPLASVDVPARMAAERRRVARRWGIDRDANLHLVQAG